MKEKKLSKDEMIQLLGQTVLTYSMCHEREIKLVSRVPSAALVIGFMCGRNNLWQDACRKFIEEHKQILEQDSAARDSDAPRSAEYGKEIKNVHR